MTTYDYHLTLNDDEAITLRAALDKYIELCDTETGNVAIGPYWARKVAAKEIQDKVMLGAVQKSGNNF